tara:strand:+ start:1843 stop:2040 length:198 start_codon:yes stop_codon:yes gene_type:complete
MEIGKKINVGTSSYGMKNCTMAYVETFEGFDYWTCSGCCHDDETIRFYGKEYKLVCHGCGAGQNL